MPRRTHWQLLVAASLLVLLAMLATLQYRWLGQVSDAERERLRVSLKTRASEFTADFDRELARTYLAFHADPGQFDADAPSALSEAVARAASATPALVRDVYVLDAQGPHAGALLRLDADRRTLEPAAWPAVLDAWRRRAAHAAALAPGALPPVFMTDAVDSLTPALIIPVPRMGQVEAGGRVAFLPDPIGAARLLIVVLDVDRLQHQLLEPLVTKHFGDANTSQYFVTIVRRDDPRQVVYSSSADATVDARTADVTTGMFDLRMDELDRLASSNAQYRVRTTEKVAITIVRRANGTGGSHVLMNGGDSQGAWQVLIRCRSGSLETLVAQSRHRNLAISLGVLGLLAGSFVLIIGTADRQRRLASQQMEFVAAVSHELRTPLAVICSAGENLADGVVADSQQVKRYGTLVETEGRRLADMVERVLAFAGIMSGTMHRGYAEVDLSNVVADAVRGVSADARERGVTVAVHSHGLLPPVMGDADALRSAVQNIVGNAVKYSASGGTVDIATDATDAAVRICVADRGLGIDAEDLPHIFKPFFRGRRAVEAQVRGSGVGLSVVRHVVGAHGGGIFVDSRAGEGTTVVVEVPIAAAGVARDRGAPHRLRLTLNRAAETPRR